MKEISIEEVKERLENISLPHFDLVVGIAEGGKAPAKIISDNLGCALKIIKINYRDEKNVPVYKEPIVLETVDLPHEAKDILVVDDVSVSGKTMATAKTLLEDYNVKALVLKGDADYVVFPELDSCVKWPWHKENNG